MYLLFSNKTIYFNLCRFVSYFLTFCCLFVLILPIYLIILYDPTVCKYLYFILRKECIIKWFYKEDE